jgi:hypothetical protein
MRKPLDFFALCAQIIRRIVVDHAGRRGYAKRGGDAVRVPIEEVSLGTRARGVEVLALNGALTSLAKIDLHLISLSLRYTGVLGITLVKLPSYQLTESAVCRRKPGKPV